jgi:hypothetical protein
METYKITVKECSSIAHIKTTILKLPTGLKNE